MHPCVCVCVWICVNSQSDTTMYSSPDVTSYETQKTNPWGNFMQSGKSPKRVNGGRIKAGVIGRFFHHKEGNDSSTVKKKDKARMENAHTHAVLSIAGLAVALASASATPIEQSKGPTSKMSMALASATELLASYCIESAESSGADRECVASVVRSAIGIRTASDLLTLTAAAATGTYI